jgi:hypothetical protein
MPMTDAYAAAGTFPDPHALARDLAAAGKRQKRACRRSPRALERIDTREQHVTPPHQPGGNW